jgi:hypothetical protein
LTRAAAVSWRLVIVALGHRVPASLGAACELDQRRR